MASAAVIAYFITPHGFGHATRAAAVMDALRRRHDSIRYELFTTSPREIFINTIENGFGYHPVRPDIGVVQLSPLQEDLSATCDQLDRLLPYDPGWVKELADQLLKLNCKLVICDIAPLGIEVARSVGIPSVLIENFTWDWIYKGYGVQKQRFRPHIEYLADLFQRADHRIQTPPLCNPAESAIFTAPISRRPKSDRNQVRKQLGIEDQSKMILVSMGGVPDRFEFISKLPNNLDCHLVVPGAATVHTSRDKLVLLPTHSSFYYPDLVAAADAMVGKAGYSTVAEVFQSGIPFGYIQRPLSPEAAVLGAFIEDQIPSIAISPERYATGEWIEQIPELLNLPYNPQRTVSGADEVADYLCTLFA